TNEPVPDATISVETPQGNVEAKPTPDGAYRIPAAWALPGGRYNLIFTVTHKEEADVLTLTLEVPAPISASGANAPTTGFAGSAMAQGIKERIAESTPSIVAVLIITFIAGALGGVWLARRKKAAAAVAILAVFGLALTRGSLAHEGEDHGTPSVAAQPNALREI